MDAWMIECPRPARFSERQAEGHYPKEIDEDSLEDITVAQHIWYIYWLLRKRDDRAVSLVAFDEGQERLLLLTLKIESLEGSVGRLGLVGRVIDAVARFFRGTTPSESISEAE